MKIAVVYYSMSKNTEFVAHEIARAVDADLIKIEPEKAYPSKGVRKFIWGGKSALMGERPALKPYEFDAAEYDLVVLGCPVWASSPAPPMSTFVRENRKALSGKRIGAFVCCSGGGADKALSKLRDMLDISAFTERLVVIDPKDKPSREKVAVIRDFALGLIG